MTCVWRRLTWCTGRQNKPDIIVTSDYEMYMCLSSVASEAKEFGPLELLGFNTGGFKSTTADEAPGTPIKRGK